MKKITVLGSAVAKDECFGATRRHDPCGGMFLAAETAARKQLESAGIVFCSEAELPPEKADGIFCLELDRELRTRIHALPPACGKVLQAMAPPFAPGISHHAADTFMDSVWARIVTWNRAFAAEHLIVCDPPYSCEDISAVPAKIREFDPSARGLAVLSREPNEIRGLVLDKNRLCRTLADCGEVEPAHIPDSPREALKLISRYPFALVMEDFWYAGFVSEVLVLCLMAGVPVIYWGDTATAKQRFPGTFIPLEAHSVEAFRAAKEKLISRRAELKKDKDEIRQMSERWKESYLAALGKAFENV